MSALQRSGATQFGATWLRLPMRSTCRVKFSSIQISFFYSQELHNFSISKSLIHRDTKLLFSKVIYIILIYTAINPKYQVKRNYWFILQMNIWQQLYYHCSFSFLRSIYCSLYCIKMEQNTNWHHVIFVKGLYKCLLIQNNKQTDCFHRDKRHNTLT